MQIEKILMGQDGIIGTVFSSKGAKNSPGLIVISGSEGGIPEYIAQRFVRDQWTVFALGYFGLPGLPDHLEGIPLEYFIKAISFFRTLPQVDPNRIGLIGNSRGAELVLLLASQTKLDVKGICALVPSCYINGGFPYPNKAAWTYNSKPIVPFIGGLTSADPNLTEKQDLETGCKSGLLPFHYGSEADPYNISDLFVAREKTIRELQKMEIPAERISVPVLMIGSEFDAIWPSKYYVEKVAKRIKLRPSPPDVRYDLHDKAGHGVAFPYFKEYDKPIFHPVGKFWCTAGGDPDANEQASHRTEEIIMEFFHSCMS